MNLRRVLLVAIVVMLSGCAAGRVRAPAPPASAALIADMEPVARAAEFLAARHGRDRVIVVYDIDNTLLAMRTLLGSDQWVTWQEHLPEPPVQGPPRRIYQAGKAACLFKVQGLLYLARAMRTTGPSVDTVPRRLRERGFRQWVLTSRSPEYVAPTLRELQRQHLRFSSFGIGNAVVPTTPSPAYDSATLERLFTPDERAKWKLGQARDVALVDGVYMTTGQHKGAMLRLLLDRLGIAGRVRGIVFVDDQKRHVDGMVEAFIGSGIELFAYRYTAEDDAAASIERPDVQRDVAREWCAFKPNVAAARSLLDPDVYNLDVSPGAPVEDCLTDICGPDAR